jgi:hypothetical protein
MGLSLPLGYFRQAWFNPAPDAMEMTMRIAFLAALTPLTLAACQMAAPEPPADACNATGWTWLIGETVDVVAASTFPAPMRVIGPGDPVTMDYLPNRLNVVYDEAGIVTDVYCG